MFWVDNSRICSSFGRGNHGGGLCHTNDQPLASLRLFQPLLKERGSMTKQRQHGVCCQKTMTGVSGVTNQSPCLYVGVLKRNVWDGRLCEKLPKLQDTEFKGIIYMKTSLIYSLTFFGSHRLSSLPWTSSKSSGCWTRQDKPITPAIQEVNKKDHNFTAHSGIHSEFKDSRGNVERT